MDLPGCCPGAEIDIKLVGWSPVAVTVAVSGEIDMDNGEHLRHVLFAMLDRTAKTLCVDMAGVTFIGSVGLRVLVECHTAARDQGRTLMLDNVGQWEQMVIDMAGLHEMFTTPDS